MPISELKRIGLLLHEDSAFIRGVLQGVIQYARPGRPWVFRTFRPDGPVKLELRSWRPHGLITHIADHNDAQMVLDTHLPAVDVSGNMQDNPLPRIPLDDAAIGATAAHHLLQRGFVHLAALSYHQAAFAQARVNGFTTTVAGHHREAVVSQFLIPLGQLRRRNARARIVADRRLRQWLVNLPKPVGVLAVNDELGLILTEACREQGIHVPEQVAVVGVDADDLICSMAHPPLSSVALPVRSLGYAAAQMLDRLMQGHKPSVPAPLAPLDVRTRQSTDIMAIVDEDLAAALRFIRLHACEPIAMPDLLQQVPVSRRSLERRFRLILGRTFLQELQRVRVEMAQQMLASTNLPMPLIAQRCGLGTGKQLSTLFHTLTGETPRSFRQRSRLSLSPTDVA
ncbi:MAG: substrate-binding domain-containing protein [Phycisphaerales bacterium]|nr:substrate-binding domain-containing protein [Phycisphaerales bacterium]